MAGTHFWKLLPLFYATTDELSAYKHLEKKNEIARRLNCPLFTFTYRQ